MAKWTQSLDSARAFYVLLFLSLVFKGVSAVCSEVINSDGVIYISAAQELSRGNFREALAIYPMPFYPLLIAGVHWFMPHWVAAGQIVSVLSLGLAVIPLYLTTRLAFGPVEAFWGGMVFALSPWLNDLGADIVRDPVFLLFFAWALFFTLRGIGEGGRSVDIILASLFCVMAFLCRVEAVVFPLAFFFVIFVLALGNGRERLRYIKRAAEFCIVPAIMGVFFVMQAGKEMVDFNRIREVLDYFRGLIRLNFLKSYLEIYEQLKDFEFNVSGWSVRGLGRGASEITRHNLWLIYFLGLFQGIFKILLPYMVFPFVYGMTVRRRLNRGRFLLLVLAFGYVMGAYVFIVQWNFIDTRYLIVPAFLFLPWVGAGVARLYARAGSATHPRIAAALLVVLFVLVPAGKSLEVIWEKEDEAVKMAGLWLAEQSGLRQLSMICTDRRIPFYSGYGMGYHPFFSSAYDEMEKIAANDDIDLMVIEDSKRKLFDPPEFEHYEIWAKHESHKNVALIYRKIP